MIHVAYGEAVRAISSASDSPVARLSVLGTRREVQKGLDDVLELLATSGRFDNENR